MMDRVAAQAVTWSTQVVTLADKGKNPLSGVTPSIGVFGHAFQTKTNTILSGVWGLVLAGCAAYFLMGIVKYARAQRHGMDDDLGAGAEALKTSGIAVGLAAAASLIVGGIFTLAS